MIERGEAMIVANGLVRRYSDAPTLKSMPVLTSVSGDVPPNPPEFIQQKFVGASYESAYAEAETFVGKAFELHGAHASAASRVPARVLDFGSGWGRISRFLLDRVSPTAIFAMDVDPEMTALVNSTLPGVNAITTTPLPPSVLADAAIDLTVAFSVFSHLAPAAHEAWAAEFGRLTRPGGTVAITVLEQGFIDGVEAAQRALAAGTADAFGRSMADLAIEVDSARRELAEGRFVYAPTSDGVRSGDFYGWAVAPRPYVEKVWGEAGFAVVEWVPSGELFPQALVFLVRRPESRSDAAARVTADVVRRGARSAGRAARSLRARSRS